METEPPIYHFAFERGLRGLPYDIILFVFSVASARIASLTFPIAILSVCMVNSWSLKVDACNFHLGKLIHF